MDPVEGVNAIIEVLTSGSSAVITAGLLTVPFTHLGRSIGNQWAWFRKNVKGLGMMAFAAGMASLVTLAWSYMPGVSMEMSFGAVVVAAVTSVVTNEITKARAKKKATK